MAYIKQLADAAFEKLLAERGSLWCSLRRGSPAHNGMVALASSHPVYGPRPLAADPERGTMASWKNVNPGLVLRYTSLQVFPACNLVGRRLDKRRERQLVAKGQLVMKEKLFKSTSGAKTTRRARHQSVLAPGALAPPRSRVGLPSSHTAVLRPRMHGDILCAPIFLQFAQLVARETTDLCSFKAPCSACR